MEEVDGGEDRDRTCSRDVGENKCIWTHLDGGSLGIKRRSCTVHLMDSVQLLGRRAGEILN